MFITFGEDNLPQIKTSSSSERIQEWKKLPSVRKCHENLFKQVKGKQRYIDRILEKVWNDIKEVPRIQIAFAISICETFLDPNESNITMSELRLKKKIEENLVSFRNFAQFLKN